MSLINALSFREYLSNRRVIKSLGSESIADALYDAPDCESWDDLKDHLEICGCDKAQMIVGRYVWGRYLRAKREASQ